MNTVRQWRRSVSVPSSYIHNSGALAQLPWLNWDTGLRGMQSQRQSQRQSSRRASRTARRASCRASKSQR